MDLTSLQKKQWKFKKNYIWNKVVECPQTEELEGHLKLNNKINQKRKMESKYQRNRMDKKRKKMLQMTFLIYNNNYK